MGIHNYLIDGASGTGKTAVCEELIRRGYHAIHGDRELAYQGDPETGETVDLRSHGRPTALTAYRHWIWDVAKVQAIAASREEPVTFFCGGNRNHAAFLNLFDAVFVLELDLATIHRRIDERLLADPTDWGGTSAERELVNRLHRTKEGLPSGQIIDASAPLEQVVDDILGHVERH